MYARMKRRLSPLDADLWQFDFFKIESRADARGGKFPARRARTVSCHYRGTSGAAGLAQFANETLCPEVVVNLYQLAWSQPHATRGVAENVKRANQ